MYDKFCYYGNILHEYLQKARTLRDQLLKTASANILLHGDLHHDNILQNGDDWMVIDPKGVIGESAYEVAAFIQNPIPELLNQPDASNIIHNRIIRLAEFLFLALDWGIIELNDSPFVVFTVLWR